jgi:hypothetical protein
MAEALVDVGVEAEPPGHPVELGSGRSQELRLKLGCLSHDTHYLLTWAGAGVRIRLKQSPIEKVGNREC